LTACSSTAGIHVSATTLPIGKSNSTSLSSPTAPSTPEPTPIPALDNGIVPSSRVTAQIVYDDKTNSLLFFGGDAHGTSGDVNDTWTWDGSNWTQQAIVGPDDSYRNGILTYDTVLQAVIQFSSFLPKLPGTLTHSDIFEDKLWKWNGHGWDTLEAWNK
jgi:hypothetical protein